MLDKQNQGPQCTACGSPVKLSAIEPSHTGPRPANVHLSAMPKGSAAHYRKRGDGGLVEAEAIPDVMYQREECLLQASMCREKAQADPARYDY
jgi:hypothetical protein